MNPSPTISRITIYPIKSLDGISLQKAVITEGGCLLHDREYAITNNEGKFIIGKSNPLVYTLRSAINFELGTLSLKHQKDSVWNTFDLQNDVKSIQTYLSAYFGMPVFLQKNATGRFLDVPDISGVTVVSTASLQSVSDGFDLMGLDETRKRFRATIEIEGVPSFWEDHLFASEGTAIEFNIGDVTLYGISPRARCVVPSRNPENGEMIHAFSTSFSKIRAEKLPNWSTLQAFGHYYYLTVDCLIPASEIGKYIELGNEIRIIGEKTFSSALDLVSIQ